MPIVRKILFHIVDSIYSQVGGCEKSNAPAPFETAFGKVHRELILHLFLQMQEKGERSEIGKVCRILTLASKCDLKAVAWLFSMKFM